MLQVDDLKVSCISNVSFWTSLKMLNTPATIFTNDFWTDTIFVPLFFCEEVKILHHSGNFLSLNC